MSTSTSTASSAPTPPGAYDALMAHQLARIRALERELARYSDKLALLKARSPFAVVPHAHPLATPPRPDMATVLHAAAAASAAAAAAHQQHQQHHASSGPGQGASGSDNDDDRTGKTRYWTEMEHNQFLYAVKLFGPKNYVAISQFVGTRTPKQVRTHAQKYQMKLEREARKRRTHGTSSSVAAVMAEQMAAAAAATATATAASVANASATTTLDSDGASATEFDFLDDSSPVSDCNLDDEEMPAPVPLGAGFKKNASLTNLADYDDFMRKITSAVNDRMDHHFAGTSPLSIELDDTDLETHVKTEQFEDSVLVDM